MAVILEVDPADIRFTQSSISFYFKSSYQGEPRISITEAVRRISYGQMSADEFKVMKGNMHNGIIYSIDNRRLWVFRRAGCKRVKISIQPQMHQRLREVLANRRLHGAIMAESYLPTVSTPPQVIIDSLHPTSTPVSKSLSKRKETFTETNSADKTTVAKRLHVTEEKIRFIQSSPKEVEQSVNKETIEDRSRQAGKTVNVQGRKQNSKTECPARANAVAVWSKKGSIIACGQQARSVQESKLKQVDEERSQARAPLITVSKKKEDVTDCGKQEEHVITVHEEQQNANYEEGSLPEATCEALWDDGKENTIGRGHDDRHIINVHESEHKAKAGSRLCGMFAALWKKVTGVLSMWMRAIRKPKQEAEGLKVLLENTHE